MIIMAVMRKRRQLPAIRKMMKAKRRWKKKLLTVIMITMSSSTTLQKRRTITQWKVIRKRMTTKLLPLHLPGLIYPKKIAFFKIKISSIYLK